LKQADEDLKRIIRRAVQDKDETIIASDEGAVVILDELEWSNIKETLHLLSDKQSLAAYSNAMCQETGRTARQA